MLGTVSGTKVDDQIQERFRFALQQGLLPRMVLQLNGISGCAAVSRSTYMRLSRLT
jgi:hypothetical protein